MPEITLSDSFGRAMYSTIKSYKINSILEIGAFDGDGSTMVLAKALSSKKCQVSLLSLESNPERFIKLQANALPFPFVKPVQASSIGRGSFSAWEFEADVWNTPFNGLKYPKEQVRSWHSHDVSALREIEYGYLDTAPHPGPWDAVLIDGGEFSGYDEFKLVRSYTKCLFLDDAFNAFKTNRIRQELLTSPEWHQIWEDPHVRNGASIFVHKKLKKESIFRRLSFSFHS